MKEKDYAEKYKTVEEVSMVECYRGGKHCTSCMHCVDHDNKFNYFEQSYCVRAKKESAN